MRDELTADDIFSEILLLRNVSDKTFIVVEGDSDCNTLDPHIAQDECTTIPAFSKTTVVEVILLADMQSIIGVLGLVDRDWIGLGEDRPTSSRIFVTDLYDLEATIFFVGGILDRLFSGHTIRDLRAAFMVDRSVSNILDLVTKLATPVGVLRWLSYHFDWQLSMRHFPAHVAINDQLRTIDLTELVKTAYGRSRFKKEVSEAEILATLNQKLEEVANDAKDYCSGHDMACCLMRILYKGFGSHQSIEAILGSTRAMLPASELRSTRFYDEIQKWATENAVSVWAAA